MLGLVAPATAECVPSEHDIHDVAPMIEEYFPGGHGEHDVDPVDAANVPVEHF